MSDNHEIDIHETTKTEDSVGKPVLARMVKVKVLAEAGLTKNGQHYPEGSEATITIQSAERFVEVGEVEIVEGEATAEPTEEAASE